MMIEKQTYFPNMPNMKEGPVLKEPEPHSPLTLVVDLIGKERLIQSLQSDAPVTIHNSAETSKVPLGTIQQNHPDLRNKFFRSSHTGLFHVLPLREHRSLFTIHAGNRALPWTNVIYEMTRFSPSTNNNMPQRGADIYYRPDLEAYEYEDKIRIERLPLCLSTGQKIENDENSGLMATPFTFVETPGQSTNKTYMLLEGQNK